MVNEVCLIIEGFWVQFDDLMLMVFDLSSCRTAIKLNAKS